MTCAFPSTSRSTRSSTLHVPRVPIHYQHDPVQTVKTSVHGAINMLGLAKRLRVRIFQASTSEVYGNPSVHPQPEGYWGHVNPIGLRSCYDEGKRCAETLFFDYHRQHGLDIKVARIFNTYGPRMHPNDGRVVSNFIVQALARRAHHDLRRRAIRRARSATSTTWSPRIIAFIERTTTFPGRSTSAIQAR